jgi:hypothetical protein
MKRESFKHQFQKTYLDGKKIDAFVQVGFFGGIRKNDWENNFEYYSGFSRRASVTDPNLPEVIFVQFGIIENNVNETNLEDVLQRIENELFRAFSSKELVLEFKKYKDKILKK